MDLHPVADILDDVRPIMPDKLLSHLPERISPTNEISISTPAIAGATQPGAVVSKIEDIFETFAGCILDEKKKMWIQIKTRGKRSNTGRSVDTAAAQFPPNEVTKTVHFPSASPMEAWKFTSLLRVLELSHEALISGIVTTKRDIFYRDPDLFVKQAVVDRHVDDLACTLGVQRDALNIVAAAKGLVAGSFRMTRNDSSCVEYSSEAEGMLIPHFREIKNLLLRDVHWVLVIEKEATFRTLATTKYWETSLGGKGILVTAKGYPDIQTRQFLHLLSTQAPSIPILALVDFDPDGFGIMSTYKYGSVALAHESQHLAVPAIRWLGVRSSDIVQDSSNKTGLLKLTPRDRKMAKRMLDKELFEVGGREQEWRRELQTMLMLDVKAEIQILGVGLEKWLDEKLLLARK